MPIVNKDKPISKMVTINDDEVVSVSVEADEHFHIGPGDWIKDAAFKCSGCNLVTIHQGQEFHILPVDETQDIKTKRAYGCTNCGKISFK